jgi:micrococcal nuclease
MRLRGVAIVAVTAAASLLGWRLGEARRAATTTHVVEALDGDTVTVRLGSGKADTLRILGVDTPEVHHPDRPVECFGPEAAAYTASRLDGRDVRLEYDTERRDRYGRLLAHVVVDGRRFGDELLAQGYARLLVIPPNGQHGRAMLQAELQARRDGRGLWGSCPSPGP